MRYEPITNIRVTGKNASRLAASQFASLPGVLRLLIRETAIREGIENPNALALATGLPYETCRRLWREESTRIDLRTIEILCNVLKVRPAQLFDYEPEPNRPKRRR